MDWPTSFAPRSDNKANNYITGTSDAVAMANANLSFINEMENEVQAALGQLEGLAMSGGLAKYNRIANTLVDTSVPELDRVDVSAIPTVEQIQSQIQNIRVGALPEAPQADEVVKYKKHIWEGPQLDAIQLKLTAYMADMGMPSSEFQAAVFDESRERKQRIRADKADLVLAITSGRGFKYANIQTAAGIKEITDQLGDDLENLDREITKLVLEWARQNYQFSIQQGIEVEKAHMDFSYKYSSIFREIYTTQVNAVLDIYKAQISMELAKLDANIKAIMARAEAYKLNADLSATEVKLKLEKDHIQVQEALGIYGQDIAEAAHVFQFRSDAAKARATTTANILQSVQVSSLGVTIGKTTSK